MYKILSKQVIGLDIKRMEVSAELISKKAKPGQFVMVMPDSKAKKIPLAIVEADPKRNLITIIFQETGETTKALGALPIGDSIFSILGPLGVPTGIKEIGTVLCVAYGVSIANILWICRAYRQCGNKVIGLFGAKTKKNLILESQMRLTCQKLYATTDDGSYERRGAVVDILPDILKKESVKMVYAVGPLDLLESIAKITSAKKIKTLVGLQPTMVDGIGLCGSCRVKINGEDTLACLDGPEFDGAKVDFTDLKMRMS